ncbi:MAG: DUF368 domain-containing protein [Candidatus Eisenbacteria bacterium]
MSDRAISREGAPPGESALLTLLKGGLIGVANIIPGVSGGTFALILGVFDRLVGALNRLGAGTVRVFFRALVAGFRGERRRELMEELRRVDAAFLALLLAGAGVVILASSFLIDYLLREQYSPTLAFFVGLILPSVAVPWGMMGRKRGAALLWAVPGVALTVGVSLAMPDKGAGSENPLVAIGTGAIAVSAMILPGISGSFVMLVMGQYQNVLAQLTSLQIGLAEGRVEWGAGLWLGCLAVGFVIGLLVFARLLRFLLVRFRSATMAFLIGLLAGSLWVLWPFKEIGAGAEVTDHSGEVKEEVRIATAPNRLPENVRETAVPLAALAAGLVGSAGMIRLGGKRGGKGDTE